MNQSAEDQVLTLRIMTLASVIDGSFTKSKRKEIEAACGVTKDPFQHPIEPRYGMIELIAEHFRRGMGLYPEDLGELRGKLTTATSEGSQRTTLACLLMYCSCIARGVFYSCSDPMNMRAAVDFRCAPCLLVNRLRYLRCPCSSTTRAIFSPRTTTHFTRLSPYLATCISVSGSYDGVMDKGLALQEMSTCDGCCRCCSYCLRGAAWTV